MAESSSSGSRARDAFLSLVSLVRRAKADYDSEGRFAKLRIQIVALFALNLVAAGVVAFASRDLTLRLDAWWQIGFPSNLIVVQNLSDRPVRDVTMVLDGRYTAHVAVLKPGSNGLEIEKEFLDAKKFAPLKDEPPKLLEIQTVDARIRLPLAKRN
ncbi:MAG: hypothetical protein HY791_12945 [Deltaproteobacteria bacterium]|nr:hypothetical protein [Deltaproteobacteria bacterium]